MNSGIFCPRAGAWRALALLALAWTFGPQTAAGQTTAFTYQGRLTDNGTPADGAYDLVFALFSASTGGSAITAPTTNSAVAVSNGLFTVALDFGPNFPGADRWLEIAARTNGGGAFVTLSPRQKITATPYAVTARNVTGVVPSGGVSGTYSSAVIFNNAANSFSGNGGGLTGVNAATLGGLSANQFWKTGGNSGTTPSANFLGTTDNQALESRVNGGRAFRLQPNSGNGPSVIGGSNTVDAIAPAATIAGGRGNEIHTQGFYSTIGGGLENIVGDSAQQVVIAGGIQNRMGIGANSSAIGGGWQNVILGNVGISVIGGGWTNSIGPLVSASAVGGGYQNSIQAHSDYCVIGGGRFNRILPTNEYAVISGGGFNQIQTGADDSTIGGGFGNTIQTNAQGSVIAGGDNHDLGANSSAIGGGVGNFIEPDADNSVISGGTGSSIHLRANSSTIAGGTLNRIETNANFSFIGGGSSNQGESNAVYAAIAGGSINTIQHDATHAVIGGGSLNTIAPFGNFSTISGGKANLITNFANFATIPGGGGNTVAGHFSFAAGKEAQALHNGAFVWADFTSANVTPFSSTGSNQFLVRAGGGVGINTASPQAPLHVLGNNSQLRLHDSVRGNFWNIYTEQLATLSASGNLLFLPGPGGTFGFIRKSDGNYFSGSDARLKKDVHGLSGVLDRVLQLRPVSYRFKSTPASAPPAIGLIAQEVETLFPEVVDEHDGLKSLSYSGLVPVALGAIQELNQQLKQELKRRDAENAELKRSMDELKLLVNELAQKLNRAER